MAASVSKIEDKMDHVEIKTSDGFTHVIPVSVFRHVSLGSLTVNKISDFIKIYQQITKEWMKLKGIK